MKRYIAIVWVLISTPIAADTLLGGEVGAHYWGRTAAGAFGETSDLTRFDFDDAQDAVFFVALEHPIPLLPNFKLRHTPLILEGQANLDQDFSLGDASFPSGSSVDTRTDLSHSDLILYYELLDNEVVSLDMGANLKWFDGEVRVESAASSSVRGERSYTAAVPMFYGRVRADLWGTGLYGSAEANYISLDRSRMADMQLALGYALIDNLSFALSVEAGYRRLDVRADDQDDFYTDLQMDGAWLGLVLDF